MGRNLLIGRYYKEMDSASFNEHVKTNALYYAAKEHLIKLDLNMNSIIAYSYEKTLNSDLSKKFIIFNQYVRTNNFFSSSESNWYEAESDEFSIAFSKILEMTEVLKHIDMKILRDSSKQNVTLEDFLCENNG